jgi:hypothetical protein
MREKFMAVSISLEVGEFGHFDLFAGANLSSVPSP